MEVNNESRFDYLERRIKENNCLYAVDENYNIVKVPIIKFISNNGEDINLAIKLNDLPKLYREPYQHASTIVIDKYKDELILNLHWNDANKGFIGVSMERNFLNLNRFYLGWSFSNAKDKRKTYIQFTKEQLMKKYDELVELQNKALIEQ